MNISRTLLSGALAIGLLAPIVAAAQSAPVQPAAAPATATGKHKGHVHGLFGRAMKTITLTDSQRQQLQQLGDQYRQAHPKGSAKVPGAEKQYHDAMLNVLTPAQRTQFETNLKQLRQESEAQNGNPQNGPFAPNPSPSASPVA